MNDEESTDMELMIKMLSRAGIKSVVRFGDPTIIKVDGAFEFYSTICFNKDGSLRFIGTGNHKEDSKWEL